VFIYANVPDNDDENRTPTNDKKRVVGKGGMLQTPVPFFDSYPFNRTKSK
jgi:hypothetical protein